MLTLETLLARIADGSLGDTPLGRFYAQRAEALRAEPGDVDVALDAALHFAALQHDLEPQGGDRGLFLIVGEDPALWERLQPEFHFSTIGFATPPGAPGGGAAASPRAWRAGPVEAEAVSAWPAPLRAVAVAVIGDRSWAENMALLETLRPRMQRSTLLLLECREADYAAAADTLAVRDGARLLPAIPTRTGRLLAVENAFGAVAAAGGADARTIPAMKPFAAAPKPSTAGFTVRLARTLPRAERLAPPPASDPAAVIEARSAMTFRARRRPIVLADPAPPERTAELIDPVFWVKPLTLTTLPDGRFNGAGFVLDREDGLLEDSFLPPAKPEEYTTWGRLYRVGPLETDGHVGFIDKRFIIQLAAGKFRPRAMPPETPRRIDGVVVAACGFYHHVYSHWLIDILSKLWALPWLEAEGLTDFKVALPDPLSPKQREMLSLLGVPEERIVLVKREEWLVADHLIVPSRPARMYDFIAPEAFALYDRLAERALAKAPVDVARMPRRIYAGRGSAAGRRRLLNEDEVTGMLDAAGYQPVEFADLSVAEEIALFRHAEAIAAPHGSALGGVVFMRPGARVCCFFVPELLRVIRHHFTITAHRDVDLVGVLGESADGRVDSSPWAVDAALIGRALDGER